MVSDADLAALLTEPEFAAVWWEAFQYGLQRRLAENHAEPVTPWDWSVDRERWTYEDPETDEHHTYSGYVILGTCRAGRRV